ncbi:DUF3408 domain-containing protein [Sphingobacterium siyangense]|uniref:DUF3408 domain-containing protein n=1 Tax=Sphingobacterium siyangense TaxID=459529 RepID=UPI001963A6CC|nr:DUF3408 domain-containing protein [Sphingobacterium siyangense]QRY55903.1 DUF3408 domain-containing protein [Sphingobacterium siyangense]
MAKGRRDFEKPVVDEQYLMNIMSGDEPLPAMNVAHSELPKEVKPVERPKSKSTKKLDYQETFLVNRFPSGRNGKVVYIREEYHERLLRIVQLTREDKVTLYSYIDNILEQHFQEYGEDITAYFNEKFKPIL